METILTIIFEAAIYFCLICVGINIIIWGVNKGLKQAIKDKGQSD